MNNQIILALVALFAVGTMTLVQQNATNQTSPGYNYSAQAKPDQTKFCADFNNDDGTIGHSCTYKSKGECKKGSIAGGDDFRGCSKNPNGDEDPPEDGSGPEDIDEPTNTEEGDGGSN